MMTDPPESANICNLLQFSTNFDILMPAGYNFVFQNFAHLNDNFY